MRKKRNLLLLLTSYQIDTSVPYHLLHIWRLFTFSCQYGGVWFILDIAHKQLAGKLDDIDRRNTCLLYTSDAADE